MESHSMGVTPPTKTKRSLRGGKDSGYCWVTAVYQGAFALSTASLLNQLADSKQLGVAAEGVRFAGAASRLYYFDVGSLSSQREWTIGQLIEAAAHAAGQGQSGASAAGVFQSAVGQAQSEQTQNVQIAQQFSTQETNLATSVDPQTITQTDMEMSNLNNAWSQWAQLSGSISG